MREPDSLTSLLAAILRTLVFLVFFVGFFAIIAATGGNDFLRFLATVVFILAAGLLAGVVPGMRRAMNDGVRFYFQFAATYFLAVGPALILVFLGRWINALGNTLLTTVYFGVIGVILLIGVVLIVPSPNRRVLFRDLRMHFGWVAPLVFLFNYIVVSLLFFGGAVAFADHPQLVTEDERMALFLFHLFKMVPGLELNATIGWENPLTENMGGLIRFLVIVFQIAVLLPVIGAAQAYWSEITGEPKAPHATPSTGGTDGSPGTPPLPPAAPAPPPEKSSTAARPGPEDSSR